jgi:hypothetical protein
MLVSFNASAARASHEEANAGSADKHAKTHIADVTAKVFIQPSRSRASIHLLDSSD